MNKHLIGKRGKDKNRRKPRADRGIKRGVQKMKIYDLKKNEFIKVKGGGF